MHVQLPVIPNYSVEIQPQGPQNGLSDGFHLLLHVVHAIERVLHIADGFWPSGGDDVADQRGSGNVPACRFWRSTLRALDDRGNNPSPSLGCRLSRPLMLLLSP